MGSVGVLMDNAALIDVISTYLYSSYNDGKLGTEWSEANAEEHAKIIIQCVVSTKPKSYRWRATD